MFNRRDFLKRLGFTISTLPLAGLKPKEYKVLDVVEIEEVVEEDEPDELPPGYFDNPYHSDATWVKAVWLPAPNGGFTLRHGDDTIIDNWDLGLDGFITTGYDDEA